MILIQSSRSDASTDDVVDWLRYLYPGRIMTRLNDAVQIESITYNINPLGAKLCFETTDGEKIGTDTLGASWYRRGYFEFNPIPFDIRSSDNWNLSSNVRSFLNKEIKNTEECIDQVLFKSAGTINKFTDNNTNKLENLALAVQAGLLVPDTLVTNNIAEVERFFVKHGQIITKSITENFIDIYFEKHVFVRLGLDTKLIGKKDLDEQIERYKNTLPLPALYQECKDKAYELRIFFLHGKFYPMAIFSQANEKTKIDFRNYDEERPNRCVPYNLPQQISNSLLQFMELADINCGSIDMIVTPKNEYVFLEVNPVGKYQWLRANCNYDIDRTIAHCIGNKSTANG